MLVNLVILATLVIMVILVNQVSLVNLALLVIQAIMVNFMISVGLVILVIFRNLTFKPLSNCDSFYLGIAQIAVAPPPEVINPVTLPPPIHYELGIENR